MQTGNIHAREARLGDATNNTIATPEGRLHFEGDAQPILFHVVSATECDPTHLNQLGIQSLTAAAGIATSGLDTSAGATRRIEVVGIDGGEHTKGRLKGAYTQVDTTNESCLIKIKLNTTNAVWTQAGEWQIILDILTGCVTGKFTVFMPAFDIMEYSSREVFVTCDGAVYADKTAHGFDKSLAGPSAATELFSNDEAAGANVVIEVADTTGFYEGNTVFVSDSSNSEWCRIKTIVTNTSITVDDLTYSYSTAAGAKIDQIDYTQTVTTVPLQRGLTKIKTFDAGINSGLVFNYPKSEQVDDTKDLIISLQYIPTENNAGASVCKFRTQYVIAGLGDDIPQTIQYGTLVDADVIPPATKYQWTTDICTIPSAVHTGKHTIGIQVSREGADAGDTYTGDIELAAIVILEPSNKLGYEA